jgi:tocopherol O-methyltransferase
MIFPRIQHEPPTVGAHYDVLDTYYREIWGEHVHHGLWETGEETPAEATGALIDLVADRAAIAAGGAARVCDVGCGYGGTARVLHESLGAEVTGLTVSRAQFAYASERTGVGLRFLCRDWLANELPASSFDAVVAIESLSHMADKERAFAECARVVKPGGRVVVCDWLAGEAPSRLERQALLEPICREGRLPSLASATEYEALARGVGLRVESFEDLSGRVGRTWLICGRRLARRLVLDAHARRFLLGPRNPDRTFAFSMVRIPLAYRTGAMRLGVLTMSKP